MAQSLQRMIIERARLLVGKPEAWTRCTVVATVDNRRLRDIMDPQARRFCARGALQRVAYDLAGAKAYRKVASAAERALCAGKDIAAINDRQGRKAVVRLFNRWLRKNA